MIRHDAGWSSPVAREAHNLEVTGSNPVPATSTRQGEIKTTRGLTHKAEATRPGFFRWIPIPRSGLRAAVCLAGVSPSLSREKRVQPAFPQKGVPLGHCLGCLSGGRFSGYQGVGPAIASRKVIFRLEEWGRRSSNKRTRGRTLVLPDAAGRRLRHVGGDSLARHRRSRAQVAAPEPTVLGLLWGGILTWG